MSRPRNTIIHERLKTVQTLLDGEIDPRRPDTTLGKAIATITGLLDPQREDSVQKVLEKAVQSVVLRDRAGSRRVATRLVEGAWPCREDNMMFSRVQGISLLATAPYLGSFVLSCILSLAYAISDEDSTMTERESMPQILSAYP